MDIFGRFARDPACLVAIDAADGGTWRSPFRPGVVYPSAVPRNFSTEPATRYDLRAVFSALGTNDFRYTLKFTIFDNSAASYAILGVPGQAYPLGAVKVNATTTNFRVTAFSNGPGGLNKGDLFTVGQHILIIEVVGKQVTITLDGVSILSWNAGTGTRIAIPPYEAMTTINGTIDEESVIDLTIGKTLFSYPNFEEKTRLITKSNVWTAGGCFEPANSASRMALSIPLRWSSLSAATFIVRTTMDTANTTIWSMGQPSNPGNAIATLRRASATQVYVRFTGVNASGTAVWRDIYIPFSPVTTMTYVIVLRYDIAANYLECYIDGQLVGSTTMGTIVAPAVDNPSLPGLTIGTLNGSDAINSQNRTTHMMVSNRGLRPNEIQLLR